MAKKRDKSRESHFITNEYFEKCGISRQVVRYRIERRDIKPAGEFQGLNLYFQIDADFLILEYWIDNYKRFLKLMESAWESFDEKINIDDCHYSDMIEILFEKDLYLNYLPEELQKLKKVVRNYFNFEAEWSIDEGNDLYDKFSEKYFEGIALRNKRFKLSHLSVDEFILEENLNKFKQKKHEDIVDEYRVRTLVRNKDWLEIKFFINQIRDTQRRQKVMSSFQHSMKSEIKRLYRANKIKEIELLLLKLKEYEMRRPKIQKEYEIYSSYYERLKSRGGKSKKDGKGKETN